MLQQVLDVFSPEKSPNVTLREKSIVPSSSAKSSRYLGFSDVCVPIAIVCGMLFVLMAMSMSVVSLSKEKGLSAQLIQLSHSIVSAPYQAHAGDGEVIKVAPVGARGLRVTMNNVPFRVAIDVSSNSPDLKATYAGKSFSVRQDWISYIKTCKTSCKVGTLQLDRLPQ